ncbi:TPA: alcohol dehydrogenase catalytic domain-containing protein, partial [Serratia odorifera]|nr:alcohol dehydrogenase catalytic domain-containing protein [Serratia odorifera]
MKVLGYAAKSAQVPLAPFEFTRRDPRPDDVVFEVLYCGVCHSDLHQARNDWGISLYPLVPGHEVIGRVTAVGDQVTRIKLGDIVGVGCMVDSCRQCQPCQQGLEQYCEQGNIQTYNGVDPHDSLPTYGGYSQTMVTTQDFVLKIPAGMDLSSAAPLLCAGITTWSPLRRW